MELTQKEQQFLDAEISEMTKDIYPDNPDEALVYFMAGAAAYKKMLEMDKWNEVGEKAHRIGIAVHQKLESELASEENIPVANFDAVSEESIVDALKDKPEYPLTLGEVFPANDAIPTKGIAVDCGAVSGKNPGIFKYRLVDIETKKILIEVTIPGTTTNNIAEWLAAVHGIGYRKAFNIEYPVYSDSQTALAWIRNRALKTKFTVTDHQQLAMIKESLEFSRTFSKSERPMFWITEKWGDICADYGRKTPRLPKK